MGKTLSDIATQADYDAFILGHLEALSSAAVPANRDDVYDAVESLTGEVVKTLEDVSAALRFSHTDPATLEGEALGEDIGDYNGALLLEMVAGRMFATDAYCVIDPKYDPAEYWEPSGVLTATPAGLRMV